MIDKISNRSDSTGNDQYMTNFNDSIIVVNGMVGMHRTMSNTIIHNLMHSNHAITNSFKR